MSDIKITIPEEIIRAFKLPRKEVEGEVQKELALALYQRGLLTSGKACEFARMSRLDFEDLLKERKISRHYTENEVREDALYACGDK